MQAETTSRADGGRFDLPIRLLAIAARQAGQKGVLREKWSSYRWHQDRYHQSA